MATCTTPRVTGTCQCALPVKNAYKLILVPLYDSLGEINKFDSTQDVTLAALQAKFDETNPLDRFYVLPYLENVEDVRADSVFSEYNSGRKKRIRQGVRTFQGWQPDGDPKYFGRMEQWMGLQFGMYAIDVDGNFVYNDDGTGAVLPIPVDGNSWDPRMVYETESDAYHTMLMFDYSRYYNDGNTWMIPKASLDFDGRIPGVLYGLLPLVPTMVTTAAGVDTKVFVETDCKVPVTGLETGDFAMYDVTADADLVVTGAVENVNIPGEYTLTATTTVQGNITRVTVTKVKYETGTLEYTVT